MGSENIITTDNSITEITLSSQQATDLKNISLCKLSQLKDSEGKNLWLFPSVTNRYDDKIEDETILSLYRKSQDKYMLETGNLMGFIGFNTTELTIRSRFSKDQENDWFMQYLLQKVFAINVFNLQHSTNADKALNIAALLFPYFLKKAIKQGMYREYIVCKHNDNRVKGCIDFNSHIRLNYPFKNSKIAYTSREYKFDNSLTQLIRHTIEFLKTDNKIYDIIISSPETAEAIRRIVEATPSYSKKKLRNVIYANTRPKIHPYYSDYTPLQKLCLHILKKEKLGYDEKSNQIHGVLFDGAWLWEEYLNQILSKAGFDHPQNKLQTGSIQPFIGRQNKYKRYPDFITRNIIADAKYKYLIKKSSKTNHLYDALQREDLNQMISYLHITSAKNGIFICPNQFNVFNETNGKLYPDTGFIIRTEEYYLYNVGTLDGDGGQIQIIGVNIPKSCTTYDDFCNRMIHIETLLKEKLFSLKNALQQS